MKTSPTAWLLLVASFLAGCGGGGETPRDADIFAGVDTGETSDENEDLFDDVVTSDSDTSQPAAVPSGEQSWSGVLPTGQERCYDNEKEIPCPKPGEPFFGQDPQFNQWKTRTFTQTGNVVFDDVTRLYWQAGYESGLTWDEANGYCEALTIGNRTEWRLPTPHELKSLINYGKLIGDMPAHPATDFPAETPNDWFWATARIQDTSTAWVVYFYDGYLEYTSKANRYSVRCVSSN